MKIPSLTGEWQQVVEWAFNSLIPCNYFRQFSGTWIMNDTWLGVMETRNNSYKFPFFSCHFSFFYDRVKNVFFINHQSARWMREWMMSCLRVAKRFCVGKKCWIKFKQKLFFQFQQNCEVFSWFFIRKSSIFGRNLSHSFVSKSVFLWRNL